MPVAASVIVCSTANALPADTVIVDSAPSATLAGSAVTDQVGVSLSSMVTVAEPTSPPWDAVTTTVSSPPSMTLSSTAVTVAVTDMSPACRVNDDDDSE